MQYEDLAIEKLKQSRILEQLEGNAIRRFCSERIEAIEIITDLEIDTIMQDS